MNLKYEREFLEKLFGVSLGDKVFKVKYNLAEGIYEIYTENDDATFKLEKSYNYLEFNDALLSFSMNPNVKRGQQKLL